MLGGEWVEGGLKSGGGAVNCDFATTDWLGAGRLDLERMAASGGGA